MKLIPDFLRLNAGENLSRRLTVTAEEALLDKNCVLSFVTPMGKLYISEKLTFYGGQSEYVIPKVLLDGKGVLFCQICFTGDDGFVIKSEIYEFPVYSACDTEGYPEADGESIKSLSEIFGLIDNKSDTGHIHDDRYYTRNETDGLFAENFGSSHNHNDIYYTETETNTLLSKKSDTGHNHDSRYATPAYVDGAFRKNADYVVEEGTVGEWTYRKWASGIAECWGIISHTLTDGVEVSGDFRFIKDLPFTFSENPFAFIHSFMGSYQMKKVYMLESSSRSLVIYSKLETGYAFSAGQVVSFLVNVKGKWK